MRNRFWLAQIGSDPNTPGQARRLSPRPLVPPAAHHCSTPALRFQAPCERFRPACARCLTAGALRLFELPQKDLSAENPWMHVLELGGGSPVVRASGTAVIENCRPMGWSSGVRWRPGCAEAGSDGRPAPPCPGVASPAPVALMYPICFPPKDHKSADRIEPIGAAPQTPTWAVWGPHDAPEHE